MHDVLSEWLLIGLLLTLGEGIANSSPISQVLLYPWSISVICTCSPGHSNLPTQLLLSSAQSLIITSPQPSQETPLLSPNICSLFPGLSLPHGLTFDMNVSNLALFLSFILSQVKSFW